VCATQVREGHSGPLSGGWAAILILAQLGIVAIVSPSHPLLIIVVIIYNDK
jgi:hypothetical protein